MHQFDDFAFLDSDALQFSHDPTADQKTVDLAAILAGNYHIEATDPIVYQATVLDAFGMPAHRSAHLLLTLSLDESDHLFVFSEEQISGFLPVSSAEPGFYWELTPSPDSGFRAQAVVDLVRHTCDLWKLQARLRLTMTNRQFRLLNKKGKTRVIVNMDYCRWPNSDGASEATTFISVVPLIGFERDATKVRKTLAKHPGTIDQNFFRKVNPQLDAFLAQETLAACTLQADLPALSAIKMLLAQSTQGMVLHTKGTIKDVDTEFLHAYRVNLRKCRSLLKEFKKLIPAQVMLEFNDFFKTLGKLTADVRDLDVYQLMLEEWLRRLNDSDAQSLLPFVDFIRQKRKAAIGVLLDYMQSPDYDKLITAWQHFLAESDNQSDSRSTVTIHQAAAKRVRKCFTKLLEDGSELDPDSPDEAFHRLRLDFKRLRYLLEYFTDIFAGKDYLKLIKMIKKLQSILGDFQDTTVQKEKMHQFSEQLAKDKTVGPDTFMLLGQMSERITGSHDELKNQFNELFPRLATPEVKQVIDSLSAIKVSQ
ncbi:MAG: hypothetical protein CSA50_01325 [Gammaproteobacteria bacterium]|nr:MAG: hypothetical protein CSA50_01325 [Gammaproteobacteria bacterium]